MRQLAKACCRRSEMNLETGEEVRTRGAYSRNKSRRSVSPDVLHVCRRPSIATTRGSQSTLEAAEGPDSSTKTREVICLPADVQVVARDFVQGRNIHRRKRSPGSLP